jgi:hypothetical protein
MDKLQTLLKWVRRKACGLIGHDYDRGVLVFDRRRRRMMVECHGCGQTSPGLVVGASPRIRYAADPLKLSADPDLDVLLVDDQMIDRLIADVFRRPDPPIGAEWRGNRLVQ